MRLSDRQKTSLWVALGWIGIVFLDSLRTIARLNVEKWAEDQGGDKLYNSLLAWPMWALDHIAGPFGFGFVLAALIFGFWDRWALMLAGIKMWRREEALAGEADNDPMLSLTDASCLMYEKASPGLRQIMQDLDNHDISDIVSWGKTALVTAGRRKIGALHGRRAPNLSYEQIKVDELAGLITQDDDTLRQAHADKPKFHDVLIKRSDALEVLRQYEDDDISL